MHDTHSVEKDLLINRRIFRLMSIENGSTPPPLRRSSESFVGNVSGSNKNTFKPLAEIGFGNLPKHQKLDSAILRTENNNNDFNQDILKNLTSFVSGQTEMVEVLKEILSTNQEVNKNILILNNNVEALGGFLSQIVTAQHAVDLSLSTGFESITAVLQNRKLD